MSASSDRFGVPLEPGWSFEDMRTDPDHPPLALLRHEGGVRAVWILDAFLRFRCNQLGPLEPPERQALRARLLDAARVAWDRLIVAAEPPADEAASHAWRLGEGLAPLFPPLLPEDLGITTRSVRLDDPAGETALAAAGLFADVRQGAARMRGLFARSSLGDFTDLLRRGELVLPSPLGGPALRAQAALPLNPNTLAYRFAADGTAFYVIASLWRSPYVAIYFPGAGLLVCPNALVESHVREHYLGASIDAAMLRHAVRHAPMIADYLSDPRREPAIVYTQDHLGHHLYNELAGLHAVLDGIGDGRIPRILMIRGRQTEMYGPIDALYPQTAGAVDRTPRGAENLAVLAYRQRLLLARPADEYVPADLARRILDLAETDPAIEEDRARHQRLRDDGFAVVCLGLRVENRAPVDQAGFFCAVIDALRERFPRLALVVDGHDAAPEAVYSSHLEFTASRPPIEAENEILAAISAHCAGLPGTAVIATVGASMSRTLFWCVRALLVVTPWGAGLAKYRWICGRPCLIVSNRTLLSPGQYERDIYDLRGYVEAPAPVAYFRPDDVDDAPDAVPLIGISHPSRHNFHVRLDRIGIRLEECLAMLDQSPINPAFSRAF